MLKYSINKNGQKIRYDILSASNFVQYDDEKLEFSVSGYGNIFANDILAFYRKDGDSIEYYAEKIVNGAETNISTTVETSPFEDVEIKVISAERRNIDGTEYIFLKFDKNLNAAVNRNGQDIKTNVAEEDIENLCDGDIFVKDDYFLFQKTSGSAENVNAVCTLFWRESNILQTSLDSIDGLIPCNVGGVEAEDTLMFISTRVSRRLFDNADIFKFYVKDLRFFTYVPKPQEISLKVWNLQTKPGVSVMVRRGDSILSFQLDRSFSPYLLANDGISQFLESEAEKRINKPLDYEKQQFVPVVKYNGTYLDVNKIAFRVHLRERDEDFNVIPDGHWNAYESGGIVYPYYSGDTIIGDNIFSKDDIYYQHKCVSETFLRLSYYDSMNRGEQKLLYTAKIHLDENRLWTEYVVNKEDPFLEFFCSNKFDINEKTEGFYLHMFPGNIKELGADGAAIYLKIELCYAKLGKTIPLTLPVYPNMNGSTSYTKAFNGKIYLKTGENGMVYTDMGELNNDTYIKIRLNYDNSAKRYVWYFNGAIEEADAEELNLILYEPKIF